jgi:hypothetical protein
MVGRPHQDFLVAREVKQRRRIWQMYSRRDHGVDVDLRLGGLQRPGHVMDFSPKNALTPIYGVQAVALG